MENPLRPQQAVIENIKRETYDTQTYTMRLEGGGAEDYSYLPGQFNMVGLTGIGEAPISLSSCPVDTGSFSHTVRAVGDVTNAIDRLHPGDRVWVRGPYGRGWPVEEAKGRRILVIAGGIGLAPLRSAILQIFCERDEYGSMEILYGARTPGDLLYTDEFETWSEQPDTRLLVTVDSAAQDQNWKGYVGVVTHLIPKAATPLRDCAILVCGPEVMMKFTVGGLLPEGVNPENIWVSLERRMKCGIAMCGHCQIGPKYVCKDGPVFRYSGIRGLFGMGI
jgi:NAD(P)H-flavin reductase